MNDLTHDQKENAAKALHLGLFQVSTDWTYGQQVTGIMRDNLRAVEIQLAKVGLAIQPILSDEEIAALNKAIQPIDK